MLEFLVWVLFELPFVSNLYFGFVFCLLPAVLAFFLQLLVCNRSRKRAVRLLPLWIAGGFLAVLAAAYASGSFALRGLALIVPELSCYTLAGSALGYLAHILWKKRRGPEGKDFSAGA